jgi:hypothetical protein
MRILKTVGENEDVRTSEFVTALPLTLRDEGQ